MYNNRLLGTITALVALAGVLVGVGQISAAPVEAAPPCNAFTVNIAGLTASEIYYSQLAAERFMDSQLCSAQPASELSASERYYAQAAQEFMGAQQVDLIPLSASGLSASEAYYAQKAALGQLSSSVLDGVMFGVPHAKVSAALGQQSNSVTYGSSEWAAALGTSAALAQQSYSVPTTGGSGKLDNRLARLDELARIKDDVSPVDSRATQMARLVELARIKDDVFPGDARAARLARLDELARIKDDVFPVDSRATQTVSAALGQQSGSFPTTGGLGDSVSATGGWRDAGASGRQLDTAPTASGVLDPTRGY